MEYAEEIKYKGYDIKIAYDENAESPEEWQEDDVKLISFHRRYGKHYDYSLSQDGFDEAIADHKKTHHVFPVYYYEHGGISFSLARSGQYADRWDSGMYGLLCLSKKEWKTKPSAFKFAKSWIETYNDYSSGNVYGFIVEDDMGDTLDSCWGYYGDAGMKDAIEEAKSIIDFTIKEQTSQHIKKRKAQIKKHIPLEYRKPIKEVNPSERIGHYVKSGERHTYKTNPYERKYRR